MRTLSMLAASGLALAVSSANAQTFTNGDFETGDLSGWTVVNTANGLGAPGSVTMIDIDGPGPLPASFAAGFMVGNAAPMGTNEGVEMTQMLNLQGGVEYTISFNWSAQRLSAVNNAEGGRYAIIVDGQEIAVVSAGQISATNPAFGDLSASFTPPAAGAYSVGLRITRPYLVPGDLTSYVDNLEITSGGGGPACYANCDGSTSIPFLNVNDFICFQSAFAAGDSYANCDQSTQEPVLNVNDFICFQAAFAAGCSAP